MSYTPTEWESTDVVTATRMNALEQAVGDMNMSYTPNVWSDGDILSADKMNALEQAVASGGGGSSDFSTAQVTVVNNVGSAFRFFMSMVIESPLEASMGFHYVPLNSTLTLQAILYKGSALAAADGTITDIQITGDAQVVEGGIMITGDCTITIS